MTTLTFYAQKVGEGWKKIIIPVPENTNPRAWRDIIKGTEWENAEIRFPSIEVGAAVESWSNEASSER